MKKLALFGVPRSGTSWLSQILNSHPSVIMRFQPLFSYGHKGRISDKSSKSDIDQFFAEILSSSDEFATMVSAAHKNYPKFSKSASPTHIAFKETRYLNVIENILEKDSEVQVIGIVRNPFATLGSWIKAPKEFHPDWNLMEEWRFARSKNLDRPEEYFGFEKWKESAKQFLIYEQRYPKQFKLINYGALRAQTEREVNDLFKFCGLATDRQVLDFLAQSHSRHDDDPYSVFRAKANDDAWREVIPQSIIDQMMFEIASEKLDIFCTPQPSK